MTCSRRTALAAICLVAVFSSARSQVSVIGDLSQDKEARPGESYEGAILVKNDTDELQEAKIYQTDYSFHFSGTNSYGEPGSHPRSNAGWVTFSPAYLTLPPQATAAVSYVVTVPRDSTLAFSGSYWSMLMVEGIARGSAESNIPDPAKKEMGISQTIRYGIHIATSIAGTGTPSVRFIESKLVRKDDGSHFLQVDIENDGDRAMRPDVYVELFDEAGLTKGKFEGVKFRLYPGTSVRQRIDLAGVAPGSYTALVVVDAGGEEAFAAQYTLKL